MAIERGELPHFYEVRKPLGQSYSAALYPAYAPHFGRDVGIIAALQHPHIRPIYESASRG
jgi:hypothetical protein